MMNYTEAMESHYRDGIETEVCFKMANDVRWMGSQILTKE